jgi:hypothetical protein
MWWQSFHSSTSQALTKRKVVWHNIATLCSYLSFFWKLEHFVPFKFSLEFSTSEIFATFLTLITSVSSSVEALRWKVLVRTTRNKAQLQWLFIKLLFNTAYSEWLWSLQPNGKRPLVFSVMNLWGLLGCQLPSLCCVLWVSVPQVYGLHGFIILNGCLVWANLLNCVKIHFDGVDYWM